MQRDTEDKIVNALQEIAGSRPDYSSINEALSGITTAIEQDATVMNVDTLNQTVINNVFIHIGDWGGTVTVTLHNALPPRPRPMPLELMTRGIRQ